MTYRKAQDIRNSKENIRYKSDMTATTLWPLVIMAISGLLPVYQQEEKW